MNKILIKHKCVSKDIIKKVKEYCKPFETSKLTVVFTNVWGFKDKRRKFHSRPNNYLGYFCNDKHADFSINQFGFKEIRRPYIVIKIPQDNWFNTFLHEFGHYIDYKTVNLNTRKSKEKFAREYAEVGCKKLNNSILADRKSQEGTKGETVSNETINVNSPSSASKEVRERSERIFDLDKADKLELLRETEPITSYDKEDDDE